MPRQYKKQIICRFCKEPFLGHFNRSYCYKEKCKNARHEEYKSYDKNRPKVRKKIKGISILKGLPDKHFRPNAWPTKDGYKKIPCLRCRHKFLSEGKHNRICETCRISNERKMPELKLEMEGLV